MDIHQPMVKLGDFGNGKVTLPGSNLADPEDFSLGRSVPALSKISAVFLDFPGFPWTRLGLSYESGVGSSLAWTEFAHLRFNADHI